MDNLRKDIVFDIKAPGANGADAKGGEPSLLSSSSLKDFEILSKLGQGSFGIVYRVRRRSDRSIYVLKQINLGNLDNRAKRDAVNEAKILATLECPHIVKYYDSFLEKSTLNIILEYCEGGDIYRIIKTQMGKFFAESKIWKYFIQMAAGLNYLHRNKILHRDLKSMNIFLTKDGEVRIGDLGVAKQLGESANFANTMVGTPYYLSPEMCEEKPYNEKSDVWALGCVLYEICTFRHPFEASNQAALIFKIIKGRYIPVSTAFYSQDLCDIVDWLLSRDYRKRPSTTQILAKPIVMAKAAQFNIQLPGSTGATTTTATTAPTKEPAATTSVPGPKAGPKDKKHAPAPAPIQRPIPVAAPPVSTGQSTNALDETTNTTAIFNENGVKGGSDGLKDHLEKLKAEFFSSKDNDMGPIQVALEKARGVVEKVGRQPPQPLPEVIKKPAPSKIAPPPTTKVELPPARIEPPPVSYVVEKPALAKVVPPPAKVEVAPPRVEPPPVKAEPIPQPVTYIQPIMEEGDSPQGHQYQAPKISPPKVVVKKTGVEFFVSMKDDGPQQALPQTQVPIYVPSQVAPSKSGGIAAMKKPVVVPMNEYVEEKPAMRKPVVAPVNEFADDRVLNVPVMKKPVLVPANEYADDKRDVKRVRKGAPKGLARNAGGSYSNNHKQKLVKMEHNKGLPKINRPKTGDANQLLAMQQNGSGQVGYRNMFSRENSGEHIPVTPTTTSTKLEEIAEVANLPDFRRKNKNGECEDSDQEDSLEVYEQQNHQYHHQFIIENPSDYLRQQMIAETVYEPQHQSPQTVTNGFYNGGECEWKVCSPQRRPESSGGSRPQSKTVIPLEQNSEEIEDEQQEPQLREEDMDHDSLEGEDSYGAKLKGEFIKSNEDKLKDALIKIREVEAHIKLRTNQVLMEVPENNWNVILNFCRRKIESDDDLNDKDQDELDYMIQKYVPASESTPLVIENIFRIIALENQASKLREDIKRLKFELIQ